MLTVDNLSLLQVLLQEFHTAIDAVLDLVISAYLHGNIVSERTKVSHVERHMSLTRHCESRRPDILCNSNQLRKAQIIT